MKFFFNLYFCSVMFGLLFLPVSAIGGTTDRDSSVYATVRESFQKAPLKFKKNIGQWDSDILYQGAAPAWGATIHFMKDKVSFGFIRENSEQTSEVKMDMMVWNLHINNCNSNAMISSENESSSRYNYFIGEDSSRWKTNVPEYNKICYANIYDNVDLFYYGTDKELKYDYIVKPGGKITDIKMSAEGIKRLSVNRKGQMEIMTPWGMLVEEIPESYQLIDGVKKKVAVRYQVVNDTTFGFVVNSSYNPDYALIIDPVTLQWSTFVGGTVAGYLYEIVIDAQKNIYGTGYYYETMPTTAGVFQGTGGNTAAIAPDAYVFKMDPTGSNLIWCTYIGGSGGWDQGFGIALTSIKEPVITGYTRGGFPMPGAGFDKGFGGNKDAFVVKFNSTGTGVIYSSYLGGSGADEGRGVAINAADEAFLSGLAASGFPTPGAGFDKTYGGGTSDGFLLKVNAGGTAAVYSTFLGGTGIDEAWRVTVNNTGEAFVTGTTSSSDFPLQNPIDGVLNGKDAFVTRVNAAGTAMIYSTFLSNNTTEGHDICLNGSGDAFVTGVSGAFSTYNVFVIKINSTGSSFIYDKSFGGNKDDESYGIAINSCDEAFVVGYTDSPDFPITACAYDATLNTGPNYDAFVVKLDVAGNIIYSTFIGGADNDYYFPSVIVPDMNDKEVIVSLTSHSNAKNGNMANQFPTTSNVLQTVKANDDQDQPVIFKLQSSAPMVDFTNTIPDCNGLVKFTDVSNGSCIWKQNWTPDSWKWDFGDGGVATVQHPSHTFAPGTYQVKLVITCPRDSVIKTIVIPNTVLDVDIGNDTSICSGTAFSITLDAGVHPGYTFSWNPGGVTTQTIQASSAGEYVVTVTNGTCTQNDTMNISLMNLPIVRVNDTTICAPATILLDAGNPGTTYSWNTTATTQTIVANASGKYWVTVGAGTCSATDTARVTIAPLPVVLLRNDTTVCEGMTILLDAGNPGNNYQWSTGETTQVININMPNTYWVRVDTNGCLVTDTFKLATIAYPVIALRDTTACIGNSLILDPGANPGAVYTWFPGGENTPVITVNASDKYWVTVSNGSCTVTDTSLVTFIPLPVVLLPNDTTICSGDTITINTGNPGSVYLWSTGATSQSIQVSSENKYWVRVGVNGCLSADTMLISETSYPAIRLEDTTVCGTTAIVLNPGGNPGVTYSWFPGGEMTPTITVDVSGKYEVRVANGLCVTNDTSDVLFLSAPLVNLGRDTIICPGESVKLDAGNPGNDIIWSTGEISQIIAVSKPGEYNVSISNGACKTTDTIVVVQPSGIDLGSDISLCDQPGAIIDAGTGALSYLWSTGESTQQISPETAGLYWAEVEKGRCKFRDTILVTGSEVGAFLYVPNTFTPNNDTRNEIFSAVGEGITSFEMKLFDRWGNLYFETNDINKGWNGKLNGNLVQQDVYIWIIEYKNICSTTIPISKIGHVTVLR